MKTLEELKKTDHLIIGGIGLDGFSGEVQFEKWKGFVICSNGGGWEHVSVCPYKKHITPSWEDMCRIKNMFWNDDECVVQYHPPKKDYVNNMPNCLHLWKPLDCEMPMPPSIMVGVRDGQTNESIKAEIRRLMEYEQLG